MNLVELNAFKEEILAPLVQFKEQMAQQPCSVAVMTAALVSLLETLGIEKKLTDQAKWFKENCMEKEAREYAEIYGLVMELFERLHDLLGDEAVSRREYLEILNAGFMELKVGMIPAGADRVVAGDLKRTRLSGIRALFFVGVNEGVVPADTSKGGILTVQER